MSKTLLAIVAVVALFAASYMFMPSTMDWLKENYRPVEMPYENNGIIGRMFEGFADLYWNPGVMAFSLATLGLATTGLVYYWRNVED